MIERIRQIDRRRLMLPDGSVFVHNYPIVEWFAAGELLVVIGRKPDTFWQYQIVPLTRDAAPDVAAHARFVAEVFAHTYIGIVPGHPNALLIPSGVRADLPGRIVMAVQVPEGFAVQVHEADVPRENIFLVDDEGRIAWQIEPNPCLPRVRASYRSIHLDGRKRLIARYDYRIPGDFVVGTKMGVIKEFINPIAALRL